MPVAGRRKVCMSKIFRVQQGRGEGKRKTVERRKGTGHAE
jgi:hypothetical protein